MADDYLIRVTTVDRDTVRVALEGSPQLLQHVLATLLEGTSQNGAAPGPPADPPPTPAATPRRYRKRRGRPTKDAHPKPSQAKGKTVSLPPLMERVSSDDTSFPQTSTGKDGKRCSFCGNHFSSKFSGSRYCSERCRAKAHELQPLPRPLEMDTVL
jgi:hypothetical protein